MSKNGQTVEESLKTAKNVEEAIKGRKPAKYRQKCLKNEKILTKKTEKP